MTSIKTDSSAKLAHVRDGASWSAALGEAIIISCDIVVQDCPLIMIHGLGGSRALWGDLLPHLRADHTLLSYDLRGAGSSREYEPRELSLDTWADDLRDLVMAVGLERPVLVGHSLGASIALKYALRFTNDVTALVLMAADAKLSNLAGRMQRSIERIEENGLETWVRDYWSQNLPLSGVSIERAPGILETYRTMLLANDASDYVRTCRAIANSEDLTSQLSRIPQPTLVLVGDLDDRMPPAHARELVARLPNARLVELRDVGHTPPLEAPQQVASCILSFLADIERPDS